MKMQKEKIISVHLMTSQWIFDTSGTVMYTFELVSHYKLNVAPTIQYFTTIFVLSNFNLLISIALMSLNKSFYMKLHAKKTGIQQYGENYEIPYVFSP